MSSVTLISELSMPLSLNPPSTISYESSNADHDSDEQPSYDTATTIDSEIQSDDGNLGPKTTTPADNSIPSMPSRLEHHRSRMALVRQLYQNIQHRMVVPETNPIYICLQLLGPAVVLLCELQQALGVESSNPLGESIAGTVGGYKESIATMEGMIDSSFTVEIDIIGSLSLEGFADRLDNEEPTNALPRFWARAVVADNTSQGIIVKVPHQAPSPRHYQFSPRPAVTPDGLQCEPDPIERQGSPRWDIFQGGSL
ncbi:hypothetical protein ACKLNR_014569 [Fusarium oxysporum f. sp. zingiberi]